MKGVKGSIRESFAYRQQMIRSDDGTMLAVQSRGNGPVIMLANGLGGHFITWSRIIEQFESRHTFISWDYRGTLDSKPPIKASALTIPDHVSDFRQIFSSLNGNRPAIIMGWSMGVQVALEFYRSFPKLVQALVLINGTYQAPLRSAFYRIVPDSLLRQGVRQLGLISPMIRLTVGAASMNPFLLPILKRLHLLNKSMDEVVIKAVLHYFSRLDFTIYSRILLHLADHSAADLLPEIHVPVLIVHGRQDIFTPLDVARTMADRIPNSQLLVLDKGTHYTPVEYPDRINEQIEIFFSELGQ